ncbi:MAG: WD40 repeat domain-containing protein [Planctomycetota bacterium]|nr:WD40 repeat domain-containing protein [Planctomycetota bacterium]
MNKVGLLSEVKNAAMFLELGPGPNELLLYPRGGIMVVDDKNLKLLREIDKDQTRGFTVSQDRSQTSWLQGTKTIIRDEKTGKTVEIDAGKRPGHAAFSPDNKLFAVGEAVTTNPRVEGSGFSVMRIFDTATGKLVHKLDAGNKGYGGVRPVFSPDGKLLAVGNRNYETRIFEVATGKQLHVFPKRMTQEIAFSPDGKTLAAAYVDGHLGLWDVESGKALHMVESGSPEIYSVAWNATGDLLATCGRAGGKQGPNSTFIRMPGKILLWNAKTFKVAKELMDVKWSGRVRFTRDNTRIVATVTKTRTLDDSARIAVWSTSAPVIVTTPKPKVDIPTLPIEHSVSLPPMGIPTVVVSPDGKRAFAPLNSKYEMGMWNLTTGEREFVFKGKHGWQVSHVGLSPDGSTVATASLDKTAKLWDAKTGDLLATMEGHTYRLNYITYSPSGKYILTCTGKQWPYVPKGPVSARTWDAKTGKQIAEFKAHMDTIRIAKFSQDEKYVLTSSDDHTARLWEVASGKELHPFPHKSKITTIEFSPDGKTILTSSSEQRSPYMEEGVRVPAEPCMKLWDAQTGKLLIHKPHQQGVTASFNESGDQIITACRGVITYWDIASGKELATRREPLISTTVVFCPNGKYCVVAEPDESLELWSIADQKPIGRMAIENPYRTFFSHDGKTFYSLTRAGEFRTWSLEGVSASKK